MYCLVCPNFEIQVCNEIPGYWYEGFLLLQHLLFGSLLKHHNIKEDAVPEIMLQRFPYPGYTQDDMLDALKKNVPLLMMVSFVYTCISTVKVITMEKERQLKASTVLLILITQKQGLKEETLIKKWRSPDERHK